MKSPEEIKKGLECCQYDSEGMLLCDECQYKTRNYDCECHSKLTADALEYIRQLEAQVGQGKDIPRKKRICPTTGLECCECKPGGPCAKEE